MTVGADLNRRRAEVGLSIDELARAMGFAGQSSIQRYLMPDYDLQLRPDMARRFESAFGGAHLEPVIAGNAPAMVLRAILCANPTAEQIIAALTANGLEIVSVVKNNAPTEFPQDPLDIVREILARRKVSANSLATSCGLAPSTLNRALNNPDHRFMLSTRTLKKIVDWDRSQDIRLEQKGRKPNV